MLSGFDLSYSFLLFFGGLAIICVLLLHKSIQLANTTSAVDPSHSVKHLYAWHTPNLRKWKGVIYSALYWVRDISFRYWAVHLLSYIKLFVYKLLRAVHKRLLGTIKFLERHEDQLKERLSDESLESRSATEQRLIKTLSQRRTAPQTVERLD